MKVVVEEKWCSYQNHSTGTAVLYIPVNTLDGLKKTTLTCHALEVIKDTMLVPMLVFKDTMLVPILVSDYVDP